MAIGRIIRIEVQKRTNVTSRCTQKGESLGRVFIQILNNHVKQNWNKKQVQYSKRQ